MFSIVHMSCSRPKFSTSTPKKKDNKLSLVLVGSFRFIPWGLPILILQITSIRGCFTYPQLAPLQPHQLPPGDSPKKTGEKKLGEFVASFGPKKKRSPKKWQHPLARGAPIGSFSEDIFFLGGRGWLIKFLVSCQNCFFVLFKPFNLVETSFQIFTKTPYYQPSNLPNKRKNILAVQVHPPRLPPPWKQGLLKGVWIIIVL